MRKLSHQANVLPQEQADFKGAQQTGGDGRRIPLAQGAVGKVGGNDHRAVLQEPVIDDAVEDGLGELGGHFGAQIVHDQQVAV